MFLLQMNWRYCNYAALLFQGDNIKLVFVFYLPHDTKLLYRKDPKISDTRNISVIILKVEQDGFFFRVMHPNDAEGIANSVDPDQTAPLGAVWSGSALFAQTCLSENLGTLRVLVFFCFIKTNRFKTKRKWSTLSIMGMSHLRICMYNFVHV